MCDVRERLKCAVDESGLKQVAIAKKIKMSETKLSNILNKRCRLDVNELVEICRVIGTTPETMFAPDEINTNHPDRAS